MACVISLVQEGIRNFERPLFVDQLGMQGRQHFTDTDSFSDRPGTQEGKQEGMKKQARSSMREGTKKQSSMREGMKKRSSMRGGMKNAISPPFDVKGQVRDLDFVARRLQSAISPPPSISSISSSAERRCNAFDEGEISPLSKVAVYPRVIKSGAAMDEEIVEELEAVKDSAANAPRRPGPRRGASADATELCLRRGGSPDADETTPSLVPKIEVPVRRNWIEGATFAQSIRNRSSIAAAGIAAAASMTINTREGIDDRDPEVFGSLAAEPFGGRPERVAIDLP